MSSKIPHPFIAELKRFVANQNAKLGPIVLGLSELMNNARLTDQEDLRQILQKQRKLSETTDMIHGVHVFHRCVCDSPTATPPASTTTATSQHSALAKPAGSGKPQPERSPNLDEASVPSNAGGLKPIKGTAKQIHQDNVMSLLLGDYLFAQSSVDLADLRFPRVVALVARGVENYTRGEFLKLQLFERLTNDSSAKSAKDSSPDELTLSPERIQTSLERYAELTCGSLLSNACLSAALLAGYGERPNDRGEVSSLAYAFGFHVGSAHRLNEILYDPAKNIPAEQVLVDRLDFKPFAGAIQTHLDRSVQLLLSLPDGARRRFLLDMLDDMRTRKWMERQAGEWDAQTEGSGGGGSAG